MPCSSKLVSVPPLSLRALVSWSAPCLLYPGGPQICSFIWTLSPWQRAQTHHVLAKVSPWPPNKPGTVQGQRGPFPRGLGLQVPWARVSWGTSSPTLGPACRGAVAHKFMGIVPRVQARLPSRAPPNLARSESFSPETAPRTVGGPGWMGGFALQGHLRAQASSVCSWCCRGWSCPRGSWLTTLTLLEPTFFPGRAPERMERILFLMNLILWSFIGRV